jgi:hypothetical protein
MQGVARRMSDGAMLALIKSWLEMAVEEEDGKGNKHRMEADQSPPTDRKTTVSFCNS